MTIKNLYRYEEEDSSVTVTPNSRSVTDIPCGVRLIADDGKILVKDEFETTCIDTDSAEGWGEVDAPIGVETRGETAVVESFNSETLK